MAVRDEDLPPLVKKEPEVQLKLPLYWATIGTTDMADIWDCDGNCLNDLRDGMPWETAKKITDAVNNCEKLKRALRTILENSTYSIGTDLVSHTTGQTVSWVKLYRQSWDALTKALKESCE
jgi:hypothetical protein